MLDAKLTGFAAAYADHRAAEGRQLSQADLLALPWLREGPHAGQWAVRARTFEAFVGRVLEPMADMWGRTLTVLDLGAGSGWLSHRVARMGHRAVAIDIRPDDVDGLGAADRLVRHSEVKFERILASFDAIPLADRTADITLFNASLHYAVDLATVLREAHRVTKRGGKIAILDSPFYRRERSGQAMVAEKRGRASEWFGEHAETLTSLDSVEFLTASRLRAASDGLNIQWRRHRVRYPLRYELRPVTAVLRNRRTPSRFDLWTASVR
jgi:SAM-dependent methyltransferase